MNKSDKNKRQESFDHWSEVLKALAHPLRLRMVWGLSQNECNVKKIVEKLGVPQSTVSQHLSVLKGKGILGLRKEGVCCCYYLKDQKVKQLVDMMIS